jgi:glycogen operon protein
MNQADWEDPMMRCFGMLMDGRAQATGIRRPSGDATLLWVLNGYHDVVNFTLPAVAGGRAWTMMFDTNLPDLATDETFVFGEVYEVTGRSTVLLALQQDRAPALLTQR